MCFQHQKLLHFLHEYRRVAPISPYECHYSSGGDTQVLVTPPFNLHLTHSYHWSANASISVYLQIFVSLEVIHTGQQPFNMKS